MATDKWSESVGKAGPGGGLPWAGGPGPSRPQPESVQQLLAGSQRLGPSALQRGIPSRALEKGRGPSSQRGLCSLLSGGGGCTALLSGPC